MDGKAQNSFRSRVVARVEFAPAALDEEGGARSSDPDTKAYSTTIQHDWSLTEYSGTPTADIRRTHHDHEVMTRPRRLFVMQQRA